MKLVFRHPLSVPHISLDYINADDSHIILLMSSIYFANNLHDVWPNGKDFRKLKWNFRSCKKNTNKIFIQTPLISILIHFIIFPLFCLNRYSKYFFLMYQYFKLNISRKRLSKFTGLIFQIHFTWAKLINNKQSKNNFRLKQLLKFENNNKKV